MGKSFIKILMMWVVFCTFVTAQCEHPDYEALMAFHHSTSVDEWRNVDDSWIYL